MSKLIDLTGQVFGRLTVIRKHSNDKYRRTIWLCKCECGKETTASRQYLIKGKKRSCGCLQSEWANIHLRPHAIRGVKKHLKKVVKEGTRLDMISSSRRLSKRNKSGVTGVHWDKASSKWRASIRVKGKDIKLGRFSSLEEATTARKEAERKYFKPILDKYKEISED